MKKTVMVALLVTAALPGIARAQTAAANFTSATRYDAMRRVTGTIAPDPDGAGLLHYAAVRNTYDAAGRLISVETGQLADWQSELVAPVDWELHTTFTVFRRLDTSYDAMDRKTLDRLSSDTYIYTATQFSYDLDGRPLCTAVRMDRNTYGALPASACDYVAPANGAEPDRITKNVYDAAGQLLQVRRAVGTSLEQAYATYAYTPNGKQSDVIDANGNRAHLTYDEFDRQQQWQFPMATPPGGYDGSTPANALSTAGGVNTADYEEYVYDANGNRTGLRKRDGRTFAMTYDALNRIVSKIVPDGCAPTQVGTCPAASATRDVYYGYDVRGLQTSARFDSASGGDAVTNNYDGFGRLRVSTTAMNGDSHTMSFNYDADGNRTQVTYPDAQTFGYGYDGIDRLSSIEQPGAGSVLLFGYDAAAQLTAVGRANGANSSMGYDGIGRLSSMMHDLSGTNADLSVSLGYNPAGQIVSEARSNDRYAWLGASNVTSGYGINGLNQYTSVKGSAYTYDLNGNLTSNGAVSYGYDVENRLVSTSAGASLAYDPLGRLWQTASSAGTTRFVYDGDQLSAEYDGSGNVLRRYIRALGEDDPMMSYEGGGLGSPRYLHADHQGSIVATSDASGNLVATNSYDEYGTPAVGNVGRFQYTGQAWLPEIAKYHYKARVYDPVVGRFLQTDPVGYKDQVNLYAYVANDPVNGRDPTGTYSCGSSMNSAQCNTFMARQKEAIGQIKGQISAMKGLQTALQNGTKLTGAQQQLSNRLNAYVGPKAGSNPGTIGSVIKAGQSMLSGLQGNRSFQASPTANGTDYATNNRLLGGKLYPSFFAASPSMQTQIVAHESGHETPGVGDRRYTDGTGPYGDANARAIARYGPDQSLRNADNLAFAFGFQRDDD